jgi:RNA recognition motif-containing protein
VYQLLVEIYFVPHSTDISTLLLPEHKLFVGMLPKNVTDAEMTDLFSQYGNIKDLQILRGSQQTSKGNFLVETIDLKRILLFLLCLFVHLAAYQL